MSTHCRGFEVLEKAVPEEMVREWQTIVDTLAKVIEVPAGLIMRVHETEIEVLVSSETEGNPYRVGAREHLLGKLYCETVMNGNRLLYIDDARKYEEWKDNPDVPLGMYSYLGVPIHWPTGEMFGTICALDSEPVKYSNTYESLLWSFVKIIEDALRLLFEIEERKRTARMLRERTEELEAFTYSVSHDLRAPLRAIDGFSNALIEDCGESLDERGVDYLHRVSDGARRMARLIEGLLRLSRITQAEICARRVSLSELALEIVERLRESEPDRRVETSIAENISAWGDRHLLGQVLENLLSNAWKFTSRIEGARLEFGLLDQEAGRVLFVKDNGAGFDMEYANRLFAPFQRLHSTEEFPGTGIGLSIVRRIVNRHDGRVWCESEVGRGTTFYFTLGEQAGELEG